MTQHPDTAVIGAGSWGTALAAHLVRGGARTVLWAREPEVVEGINAHRRNPLFLSEVDVPDSLRATGDLEETVSGVEVVVSSVPTQFVRSIFSKIATSLDHIEAIVSVSKGIEIDTLLTPTEILSDFLPEQMGPRLLTLSGPSFAVEVAAGIPTAVVAAGRNVDRTRLIQQLLSDEGFRVYGSDDLVGVELGGALKNVIAIGTGIVDGLGLGRNTRAALITRGLAEITRLGVARGANPLTFSGLSGIGDLVLTCTGDLSRNRQVGLGLGRGQTPAEVLAEMTEVAEGVKTTAGARQLAVETGVVMPITEQAYQVLYEGKEPRASVLELMGRELKDERA